MTEPESSLKVHALNLFMRMSWWNPGTGKPRVIDDMDASEIPMAPWGTRRYEHSSGLAILHDLCFNLFYSQPMGSVWLFKLTTN